MEVKVIMEERRDNFENEIKKYLENNYKIQNSNIIVINKINNTFKSIEKNYKTMFNDEKSYTLCFYALLIKE